MKSYDIRKYSQAIGIQVNLAEIEVTGGRLGSQAGLSNDVENIEEPETENDVSIKTFSP